MQRVARRVNQENMRLRSLLARHGVSTEEVDLYLRSFDGTSLMTLNSASTTTSTAIIAHPETISTATPLGDAGLFARQGRAPDQISTESESQHRAPQLVIAPTTETLPPTCMADNNSDDFLLHRGFGNVCKEGYDVVLPMENEISALHQNLDKSAVILTC